MTLSATPPLTMTDVMAELRIGNPSRAYPISLGDTDVRKLAGKLSGAVSLSDLYGKTGYVPMSGSVPDVEGGSSVVDTSNKSTVDVAVSVVFADGLPAYSYAWTKVSGANAAVIAANAASTVVRFTINKTAIPGNVLIAVAQCVVTDGIGNTLTRSGTVTLTLT